jgi:hypothetical protein
VLIVGQYFAIKSSARVRKDFYRMRADKEVPTKTILFSLAGGKNKETGSVCNRKCAGAVAGNVLGL